MATKQNKTQPDGQSVTALIDAIEDETRREDCRTLVEFFERVTGAPAKTWGSIIGFGTYKYQRADKSEHTFMMTGFANRKTALTMYILPGYEDYSEPLSRIGKFKKGKSCLYVKRLSDIDLNVLEEIVVDSLKVLEARYETRRE